MKDRHIVLNLNPAILMIIQLVIHILPFFRMQCMTSLDCIGLSFLWVGMSDIYPKMGPLMIIGSYPLSICCLLQLGEVC